VTGLCYFGVSIVGFHAFGTAVPDNVLLAFAHGSHFWVVSAANLMVVVHVAAAYQGEKEEVAALPALFTRAAVELHLRGHAAIIKNCWHHFVASLWHALLYAQLQLHRNLYNV
jgi:hypothetical protein